MDLGVGTTMPVGSFPAGASPFGVLDMAGNADEWTSTLYTPYPGAPAEVPETENGSAATAATGGEAWQYGPGFLWEEIEQTWWEYETAGRPVAEQFGLTVTDRGQHVWLWDPSRVIGPGRWRW